MKIWQFILMLLLVLSLGSCGSGKRNQRVAYEDDIYNKSNTSINNQSDINSKNSLLDKLLTEAYSWEGTPYKMGGHSRQGTDCSGYIMEVFKAALGIELPRNSAKQSEACQKVKKNKMQPGDLLFFHPNKKGKVSHVGLYVGNGKMLHVSGKKGVIECDIEIPYWENCFNHAGRIPLIENKPSNEKPVNAVESPNWKF